MHFICDSDIDELFFSGVILIHNYKNRKMYCIWIYYKEDGKIDKVEDYRNGELHGSGVERSGHHLQ